MTASAANIICSTAGANQRNFSLIPDLRPGTGVPSRSNYRYHIVGQRKGGLADMTADSEEPISGLPQFRVLDAIGTLPGTRPHDADPLGQLLLAIVAASRCNHIEAPARAPDDPSLLGELAVLQAASADIEVIPGLPLSEVFWTHHSHLRNGDVAARLKAVGRRAATARPGGVISGFIATYATHVRSPLLYGPKRLPLRAREGVAVSGTAGGPYLALVQCRLSAKGTAEAIRVFAQPIYHARRFVPVASELERDVLRALEALQIALDAHGVECDVERVVEAGANRDTPRIVLTAGREGREPQRLAIAVASAQDHAPTADADFVVTPARFADGGFVAWLDAAVAR